MHKHQTLKYLEPLSWTMRGPNFPICVINVKTLLDEYKKYPKIFKHVQSYIQYMIFLKVIKHSIN